MSIQERELTRSFYDRISHVYDLIADAGEHQAREKGLEVLAAQEGERVLEIGYGTGHSLPFLAEGVGPSGRVAGVDISQGMHDHASKRIAESEFRSHIELEVAAIPPVPFDDDSFDAVSMSFLLELFPIEQIPDVLAEVFRVLRPGGRVSIVSMATTTAGEKNSFLEHTYKWLHKHFPHIVDCQPIDVAKFLNEAGYTEVLESRMKIWTLPVAILLGTKAS